MAESENDIFDIGVEGTQKVTPLRRSRQTQTSRQRRSLPLWAVVALAVLVGWILGSVMAPTSTPDDTVAQPVDQPQALADTTAVEPGPVEDDPLGRDPVDRGNRLTDEGPVEAVYQQTSGSTRPDGGPIPGLFVDDVTVVIAEPESVPGALVPATINVFEAGIFTRYAVDKPVAEPTQAVVGHVDHRMLVVEDKVLFIAGESVMLFDLAEKNSPSTLAEASSLLPGSDPGHAWAVSADGMSVVDINVREGLVRAEYDLTNVGMPLASYRGGLVVAPENARLGRFALWSPSRGIDKIWSIDDDATFIDAASNVIVLQTAQGLASYNAVTGALTQTERSVSARQQDRSFVSPDGARLAIVERETVADLPTVVIVDLASGEAIDEFVAASEWQLHWVSNHEMLSVSPHNRPARVVLRDTSEASSTSILELAGPTYWVTVVS